MKVLSVIVVLFFWNCSFGQLVTSTAQSPTSLVQNVLLGAGVSVSNIQYTGAANTIGSFTAANTNLGITSGIIMSSGTVLKTSDGPQGPNNLAGASFDNFAPGLSLLDNIVPDGFKTKNAAYLQLNFIPQSDSIHFKYVFASEEYPEYAPGGSEPANFNDVFAFFISGPGIVGQQNIAKLPNGSIVSINSVNAVTNSSYFVSNGDGSTAPFNTSPNYIQFDGFTKVLTASAKVQCGKTYHLILAVADVNDGMFDSAIFLEANSLKGGDEIAITPSISYDAYNDPTLLAEGCTSATLVINRKGTQLPALSIPITIGGTATMGVDFDFIPSMLNFAQGESSKSIVFQAISDILVEGIETILINFMSQDACGNLIPLDFIFRIKDPEFLSVKVEPGSPVCPGDDVNVYARVYGGVGPFNFIWSPTGETTQTISVNPTITSLYKVEILDLCLQLGAKDESFVTVPVPISMVINQTANLSEICPYLTKTLVTSVTGGTQPYSYKWIATEVPKTLGFLPSQEVTPFTTTIYTVTVTDYCGEVKEDYTTYSVLSSELVLKMSPDIEICPGDSVQIWVKPSGGRPLPDSVYFYKWAENKIADSSFWVNPLQTTSYIVSVSDSCQTFTKEGKVTVTVIKPVANFEISSLTLFEDLPISFQNLSEYGANYIWRFGDGNRSNLTHPNNMYLDPGTYMVHLTVIDKKGCLDSISKPITIEEEYYVYVPNTFTPDDGRSNPYFFASTIGIKSFKILICNRWGEIVFESNDQYFKWDGKSNNVLSQPGVYSYKIHCVSNSLKQLEFAGHITLLL